MCGWITWVKRWNNTGTIYILPSLPTFFGVLTFFLIIHHWVTRYKSILNTRCTNACIYIILQTFDLQDVKSIFMLLCAGTFHGRKDGKTLAQWLFHLRCKFLWSAPILLDHSSTRYNKYIKYAGAMHVHKSFTNIQHTGYEKYF